MTTSPEVGLAYLEFDWERLNNKNATLLQFINGFVLQPCAPRWGAPPF